MPRAVDEPGLTGELLIADRLFLLVDKGGQIWYEWPLFVRPQTELRGNYRRYGYERGVGGVLYC